MIRALRTTRPVLLLSLVLTAMHPCGAASQDVEEILSYDVSVDVRPGGGLLVSEHITVRALGDEIRRGIYRDFPTTFPRWAGLGRIEAPFEARRVLRDGEPEPFTVFSIGDGPGRGALRILTGEPGGVRIRAGSENVLLDPGVHDYTFEYETDRWVRFGDDEDALYWNVTGNGWSFPIRSASARIHIEELAVPPILEAWTGPEGSTARDVESSWDAAAREASFRTTGGLGAGEGLTVRLTFPSGQLTPPSEEQRAAWFALDWGGYVEAGYVVLLVIAIYLLMWRSVGVDPAAGPVVLRSEPPKGFSPAALAYLEERGYEMNQLAAALVSMAMKGAIRIERTGDTWTLHNENPDAELSPEERQVFDELVGGSSRIVLARSRHARLRAAIKGLRKTLSRQLEREYFVNNRRWFAAGLVVSVLGLAVLAWRWRFAIDPTALFLVFWLTGWTAGVVTMVTRIVQMARAAKRQPIMLGGAVMLSIFSLPFLGAEIVVGGLLTTMLPSHLVLAAVVVAATNVLFYHLLERPTLRGRGVLNQLDGFKAYLQGDERSARPRAEGIERFERFLPYAIALGLEERWADGFGKALVTGGTSTSAPYYPRWYDLDDGARFDPSTFASSLGSGLASTLSSVSTPPSSGGSSGGGGGGSSGGGGGGGGGGGW
ncbi:MAG: DUF2207 domain-containing protein [Gemmatimonadota bacterium]|jgi:uncharacterized membrane protein YgcG